MCCQYVLASRVKLQETSFNDLLMTANATHSSTVGTVHVLVQGMFNSANVHVHCKHTFKINNIVGAA
jgi:hypothetical protein